MFSSSHGLHLIEIGKNCKYFFASTFLFDLPRNDVFSSSFRWINYVNRTLPPYKFQSNKENSIFFSTTLLLDECMRWKRPETETLSCKCVKNKRMVWVSLSLLQSISFFPIRRTNWREKKSLLGWRVCVGKERRTQNILRKSFARKMFYWPFTIMFWNEELLVQYTSYCCRHPKAHKKEIFSPRLFSLH